MSEHYRQLRERELKAEKLGEGSWRNRQSGEWCSVEVTFYPKVRLWITENSKRREIARPELEKEYEKLAI